MAVEIDEEYVMEKVDAFNVAISALRYHESDSDTQFSRAMRRRLADRLDRECQRWVNNHPPYGGG